MSETFASAAAALPDGGASIAASLTAPTSAPTGTAAPADAPTARQSPDPDSTGSAPRAAVDPALSSEPAAAAPAALDPTVLAQARTQLEADPSLAPVFELRNAFSDGDLKEFRQTITSLATNPKQFAQDLVAHLRAAGQWNEPATATPAPATAPQSFTLPEADLFSPDGTQKAYSADALGKILESFRADLEAKFNGTLAPMLSERQTAEEQRQLVQLTETKKAEIAPQLDRARKLLPDFKSLEPRIYEVLKADFAKPAHMRQFKGDFYAAYEAVKQSHPQSLPSDSIKLSDLKAKAEAATSRPAIRATAGGNSRPPKTFAEAAQRNKALAESAAASLMR